METVTFSPSGKSIELSAVLVGRDLGGRKTRKHLIPSSPMKIKELRLSAG